MYEHGNTQYIFQFHAIMKEYSYRNPESRSFTADSTFNIFCYVAMLNVNPKCNPDLCITDLRCIDNLYRAVQAMQSSGIRNASAWRLQRKIIRTHKRTYSRSWISLFWWVVWYTSTRWLQWEIRRTFKRTYSGGRISFTLGWMIWNAVAGSFECVIGRTYNLTDALSG